VRLASGKAATGVALVAALVLAAPAEATFPGANGKIAFPYCDATQTTCGLFTVNPDGTERTQITHVQRGECIDVYSGSYEAGRDYNPAWSADGKKIVFVREPPGCGPHRLYSVNADGSDLTQLTDDYGLNPTWSPDGSRIAFERGRTIWIMDADGSNETPVSGWLFNDTPDQSPNWSPDGSKIAFVSLLPVDSVSNYSANRVFTMKPDGSDRTQLTIWDSYYRHDYDPVWSPDGGIAFTGKTPWPAPANRSDVWTMSADGSNRSNVTQDQWDGTVLSVLSWSPDGSKILFLNSNSGLFLMNPDGSEKTFLLDSYDADWQPIPRNAAPDCSGVVATPSSLRSHNHAFRTVALSGARDPDGDAVSIAIDGVTQDEPVGHRPDAQPGHRPSQVQLRAERDSKGDGRVYRIAFTASDGNDGECTGVATVEVRRKKNEPAVDSAPPSYDSFGF
jgi:Tol biopolymer transport system component